MVEWAHPGFLALLPAIGLLIILRRNSLANLPPFRARLALVLRAAVLALLALSLAGPRWLQPESQPNVLFLVDESPSVADSGRAQAENFLKQAEAARPPGGQSATAHFSNSLRMTRGFSGETEAGALPEAASNLSRSLQLAAALLPPGPGRIVVLSDGQGTDGLLETKSVRFEIDAVPLAADERPDVRINRLSAPERIRPGEAFNATVALEANRTGEAKVGLFQDGFLVAEHPMTLTGKPQTLLFRNLRPQSSPSRLEAVVTWSEDGRPENDRGQAAVFSEGRPRVLLVDPQPDQLAPLAAALRAAEMAPEVRPQTAFPRTAAELAGFDLILLSNLSAESLDNDQVAALRTWVEDLGGGLVVTGGPDSLGAGGYFRTPLEELLPVWSEHPDKLDLPVSALSVILDRSGSMTAIVAGQTKMDLANRGAIGALEALQNRDYFGVMAVDVRPQIVLPLAPIGDRALAQRAIRAIRSAGGGIYVYSALQEAYRQLRVAPAKIKHVILFADASDAEEKSGPGGQSSADLAAVALGNKVTTSVVALGNESDKDTGFLRQLAQSGGGRFYLTDDATALPQLFARETQRATQSSLIEEAFIPEVEKNARLEGIDWASAPPLLGYNAVRLKPGADLRMRAANGDPLLASWPLGLGNVAVFTSDATSRWAAEWLAWPGFGQFWTQLTRSLLRETAAGDFDAAVTEESGLLRVEIRSENPDAQWTLQAIGSGGEILSPEVRPIAPGEWRAEMPAGEAKDWTISIRERTGNRARDFYWHRNYPAEFATPENGTELLQTLTRQSGGRMNPSPAEVWRPVQPPAHRARNLAPGLLLLAALLFVADVANRRWLGGNRPSENPLATS